jgi:hypothetical protein
MRRFGGVLATAAAAAALAGCGEEERPQPLRASGTAVALTLEWPGAQPWALITYQREDGRRCHAIGTLTPAGPRLLSRPDVPLGDALAYGRTPCLGKDPQSVSVTVRSAPGGAGQLVGGLAARGVKALRIGDQRVRPNARGAFLVHRAGGATGDTLRVESRSGREVAHPLRTSTW